MCMSLKTIYGDHLIDLSLMPAKPTIVDAGSCEGKVRDELMAIYPDANYISIDPIETGTALTAFGGEVRSFYVLDGLPEWGNLYGKHLDTKHHKFKGSRKIMVDTIGINDLDHPIHYFKMDIEGAEFEVIEAMQTADHIDQISIEIHGDPQRIVDKIKALGFTNFVLLPNGPHHELYANRNEK